LIEAKHSAEAFHALDDSILMPGDPTGQCCNEETMSEAQENRTPGRPWDLWLIGIVGGLWSSIGVFGGVLGCLLLLHKNRLAFHVLLASVIGAIVSNLGGRFLLGGMEAMAGTGA
jgi:hypothetical protein